MSPEYVSKDGTGAWLLRLLSLLALYNVIGDD